MILSVDTTPTRKRVEVIKNTLQEKNINNEVEMLRRQLEGKLELIDEIAKSEELNKLMQKADKAAPNILTALIQLRKVIK